MSNNASKFTWNQESVDKLVHDAAREIRVVRPLIKLYGKQGSYTTNIFGHQIKDRQNDKDKRSPLSIPINQCLTPIILSCDFMLQQEQFNDADALVALAIDAAYRVAAAEDAVILLGEDAHDSLETLRVKTDREQLKSQTGLLAKGTPALAPERSILDSIVDGIADLAKAGRFGRYAAVVSVDLFGQAFRPRTNAMDAPIYEIRPLLIDGGFRQSQFLPDRTGVIFSVSGDAIKIAVPIDTSVEFVEEKKDVFLQVVEQIRLVVDVPEAVIALR